jgi:hypothetical protein
MGAEWNFMQHIWKETGNVSDQTSLRTVTNKVTERNRIQCNVLIVSADMDLLTFSAKDNRNTRTDSRYSRLTVRHRIYKMCVQRELTQTCNLKCHWKVCVCYGSWSHVLHRSTILTALYYRGADFVYTRSPDMGRVKIME